MGLHEVCTGRGRGQGRGRGRGDLDIEVEYCAGWDGWWCALLPVSQSCTGVAKSHCAYNIVQLSA